MSVQSLRLLLDVDVVPRMFANWPLFSAMSDDEQTYLGWGNVIVCSLAWRGGFNRFTLTGASNGGRVSSILYSVLFPLFFSWPVHAQAALA